MTRREVAKYVDDLLAGRQPRPFTPDEFELAEMRTAIELAALRRGADDPDREFVKGLEALLAQQMSTGSTPPRTRSATRRQVMVGTGAAATVAVASVAVDRVLLQGTAGQVAHGSAELLPADGSWQVVADSAAVAEGSVHSFDLGSVSGFIRRSGGRVEAVSGVCTHQGCKLWFEQSTDRLRCPCHSTSFSPAGQVLTHALPVAPKPLPQFVVRERTGVIEVLAPAGEPV